MNNLVGQMPKAKQDALHSRLRDFMYCAGKPWVRGVGRYGCESLTVASDHNTFPCISGPNCFNPPPAPPASIELAPQQQQRNAGLTKQRPPL
jgi:hypothetical protein